MEPKKLSSNQLYQAKLMIRILVLCYIFCIGWALSDGVIDFVYPFIIIIILHAVITCKSHKMRIIHILVVLACLGLRYIDRYSNSLIYKITSKEFTLTKDFNICLHDKSTYYENPCTEKQYRRLIKEMPQNVFSFKKGEVVTLKWTRNDFGYGEFQILEAKKDGKFVTISSSHMHHFSRDYLETSLDHNNSNFGLKILNILYLPAIMFLIIWIMKYIKLLTINSRTTTQIPANETKSKDDSNNSTIGLIVRTIVRFACIFFITASILNDGFTGPVLGIPFVFLLFTDYKKFVIRSHFKKHILLTYLIILMSLLFIRVNKSTSPLYYPAVGQTVELREDTYFVRSKKWNTIYLYHNEQSAKKTMEEDYFLDIHKAKKGSKFHIIKQAVSGHADLGTDYALLFTTLDKENVEFLASNDRKDRNAFNFYNLHKYFIANKGTRTLQLYIMILELSLIYVFYFPALFITFGFYYGAIGIEKLGATKK